ncbi:hypothetical protein K469DRAFT_345463 [Zopfia rhizophila CBS 207.26]|uniref:Uncharacterized protein n=1 Tax=Zopfia rhizophila CBS 207.26 TaxID=1314779 RepID=A0A6A6ELB1_9PEZI|nr:hypothetical protein K469DRAFT_345463 [Zopfia rhizophila CBS 207.26]
MTGKYKTTGRYRNEAHIVHRQSASLSRDFTSDEAGYAPLVASFTPHTSILPRVKLVMTTEIRDTGEAETDMVTRRAVSLSSGFPPNKETMFQMQGQSRRLMRYECGWIYCGTGHKFCTTSVRQNGPSGVAKVLITYKTQYFVNPPSAAITAAQRSLILSRSS